MKNLIHKLKIIFITLFIIVVFAVGGFLAIPNEYKVFPNAENFEIELGTQLDTDISTYIRGIENAVNEAQLDFSDVDIFTAGDYQVYVKIGKKTIPYNVKIVDTVAPCLSVNPEIKHVATNREYDVYHFVSEVTDLSNTSEVYFKTDDTLQSTISFDTPGEHTLTFVAKDINGNETEQKATIIAHVPPRFMGLADMVIPIGADFNYSQYFFVYDETDGFITDTVTIDDKNVDLSKEGVYEISYSVVNSKGIDNHKTVTITTSADATNAYKNTTNLTSDDWDILTKNSYFEYELLDETNEDHNATIDLVKPTCLNMNIGNRSFSGFIYKIEEDYIYAVAARHSLINVNGPVNMIFFNDETISTNIEYKTLKNVTDLGLFRFKTSNVPKDLLYSLKQVYLDIEYTSQLTDNQNLIEYSENHVYPFATSQKIKLVKLKNQNEANHGWAFSDSMITTTRGGIAGMSGCGVFDYQGRVVGIASHISDITKLDYLARLDRLVELETNLREND